MKYKVGDILVNRIGWKRKVLSVSDKTEEFFLSHVDFHDIPYYPYSLAALEREGWKLEEQEWKVKIDEDYYFIDSASGVEEDYWSNDFIDNSRKNFLGIFKDQESAQKRIDEIKAMLKK